MSIKPVLVPDHTANDLRRLMDHFAEAATGPTRQQLAESRAAVAAAQGVAEAAKWRTHPDAHDHDTDGSPMPKGGIKSDPLATRQGVSRTQSEKDPKSLAGKFGDKYAKKHGVPTKQLMKNIPLDDIAEQGVAEGFNEDILDKLKKSWDWLSFKDEREGKQETGEEWAARYMKDLEGQRQDEREGKPIRRNRAKDEMMAKTFSDRDERDVDEGVAEGSVARYDLYNVVIEYFNGGKGHRNAMALRKKAESGMSAKNLAVLLNDFSKKKWGSTLNGSDAIDAVKNIVYPYDFEQGVKKDLSEALAQGNYDVGLEDIGEPVLVNGKEGYILLHIERHGGSGKLVAKVLQPDFGAKGYHDLDTISRVQQGVAEGRGKNDAMILRLYTGGKSPETIATQLNIDVDAVKDYIQNRMPQSDEAPRSRGYSSGRTVGQGMNEQGVKKMSPQQQHDFDRMRYGAMSRKEYDAKWKKPLKSDDEVIYGKKKSVSEGFMDTVKQAFNDAVVGHPMGTSDEQFIKSWADDIRDRTGRDIPAEKLARLYQDYAERSDEIMQSHGTTNEESGVTEARPDVMRHPGDTTVRVVKKGGKPIGEIGTDAEASPGNGAYYVKLYDGSYDAVGFDTAEEALAELKYAVKQMSEGSLTEFAPSDSGGDDDGFDEDTLRKLAAQWFAGDEDPQVERLLAAAGWEIGQDEGYDDEPGVFVVLSGDDDGRSYISWPAEEMRSAMSEGKKRAARYHIVGKDGNPASLVSYADQASAVKDRDDKHPGAEVRQVGPRGKIKGVTEAGAEDNEGNPVVSAILRRILHNPRHSVIERYGARAVMDAVKEVADFVGDVEEIGSSDVSGWVRHVEQMLGNMEPDVTEQQVDELSPKTLGSYIKKSSADAAERQGEVSGRNQFGKGAEFAVKAFYGDQIQPNPTRTDSRIAKRQAGIDQAVDRLTAEDVAESRDPIEQLRADIRRFSR